MALSQAPTTLIEAVAWRRRPGGSHADPYPIGGLRPVLAFELELDPVHALCLRQDLCDPVGEDDLTARGLALEA